MNDRQDNNIETTPNNVQGSDGLDRILHFRHLFPLAFCPSINKIRTIYAFKNLSSYPCCLTYKTPLMVNNKFTNNWKSSVHKYLRETYNIHHLLHPQMLYISHSHHHRSFYLDHTTSHDTSIILFLLFSGCAPEFVQKFLFMLLPLIYYSWSILCNMTTNHKPTPLFETVCRF